MDIDTSIPLVMVSLIDTFVITSSVRIQDDYLTCWDEEFDRPFSCLLSQVISIEGYHRPDDDPDQLELF